MDADKINDLKKVMIDNSFNAEDKICICLPEISEKDIAINICEQLNLKVFTFDVNQIDEINLTDFLNQNEIKGLIIADWISNDNQLIPTKTIADRSSINVPSLEKIFVVKHMNKSISWLDGRDVWF